MLYELIAIVRPGSLKEVKEIAKNAGVQVLRSGGVVRGYTNWGTFTLPKPTTKHQARYSEGWHFIMRFDASGPVQAAVRRTLSLDPRMIRFSVVKLGDKLEEINDVPGNVNWNSTKMLLSDSLNLRGSFRSRDLNESTILGSPIRRTPS
ncbi:37S ribosomal protein Mrp17 [Talaromyces stipitatus ATCC 10500]|uniref:Small ribosomal subunit protein bS6m n=1 Tax=Talaromyces stipitatus (strain ATCC 10500 / CBS 375.48 / QM 6759 / NRRL 1006) TaxID=441959 RepID=B8MK36_TALSN|nr:mitochondrial 37S ribosomal protein YmS16 [Talaromyces stipitatus ATCC 10500]EED14853.1 37S ribosomal protein Mrp17 [Talaromyces stipitatus ATCC 10500]